MKTLTYNPSIFVVPDLEAARRIILTPEPGVDTDERWVRETPYICDLLAGHVDLGPGTVVVDYGCGVGRIAKAIIDRYGCQVIGVDFSEDMLRLSTDYVASDRYTPMYPQAFREAVANGLRADAAVAIWVIQHCMKPGEIIDLLGASLKPAGRLLVVNSQSRCVPVVEQAWADDGFDVQAALGSTLSACAEGDLDPEAIGQFTAQHSFWGVYAPR